MTISRADAEAIRDALQALLFFASHRPQSCDDYSSVGSAWQTIERLTTNPIAIPGEDSERWTFALRDAAWKAHCFAKAPTSSPPTEILQRIRECQDTLRVIVTADELRETNPPSESSPSQGAHPKQSTAIKIPSRAQKAWEQYRQAAEAFGGGEPTDRQVHDQLTAALKSSGESADVPAFETWQRNLREYRRLTDQQKNKSRAGRAQPRASSVPLDLLGAAEQPTRIRQKRADE